MTSSKIKTPQSGGTQFPVLGIVENKINEDNFGQVSEVVLEAVKMITASLFGFSNENKEKPSRVVLEEAPQDSLSLGGYYPTLGTVMVYRRNGRGDLDIVGTLAHELTHSLEDGEALKEEYVAPSSDLSDFSYFDSPVERRARQVEKIIASFLREGCVKWVYLGMDRPSSSPRRKVNTALRELAEKIQKIIQED